MQSESMAHKKIVEALAALKFRDDQTQEIFSNLTASVCDYCLYHLFCAKRSRNILVIMSGTDYMSTDFLINVASGERGQ